MAKEKTEEYTDPAQKFYSRKNRSMGLDKEVDNYAMWAFGIAIGGPFIALYTFWIPFLNMLLILLPITALVLSIISLVRLRDNKKSKGRGFAIAALIISAIEIIIGIVGILAMIFMFLPS